MLSGKNMTFTGCGNTMANQSKQEKKRSPWFPRPASCRPGSPGSWNWKNKAGPTCGRETGCRPSCPGNITAACHGTADKRLHCLRRCRRLR